MLTLILIVKLVSEIALLSLLGRGLLGALVGGQRTGNPIYALLCILTRPFVCMARWITPAFVLDRHHPLVAFCVLGVVWIFATLAKISVCVETGMSHCR